LSADGRRLAIVGSGWGNDAKLFDTTTGGAIGPPLTHPAILTRVAFTPDSKTLLTGGHGQFRRWDAETGQPRGDPFPHDARTVLVPSPDGKRVLAAGSWDESIHEWPAQVWDLAKRERVGKNLHHWGLVLTAAFHPDGRAVLAGSVDRTARLWDAETGEPLGPPLLHDGAVVFAAFSPDGHSVLTRSLDGKARLWEPTSGMLLAPALTHDGRLLTAAFHPSGRSVLTGGEDRMLRVWTVPAPAEGSSEELIQRTSELTGMRLDPLGLAYPSPAR
jgi:WD40 repeat protein